FGDQHIIRANWPRYWIEVEGQSRRRNQMSCRGRSRDVITSDELDDRTIAKAGPGYCNRRGADPTRWPIGATGWFARAVRAVIRCDGGDDESTGGCSKIIRSRAADLSTVDEYIKHPATWRGG